MMSYLNKDCFSVVRVITGELSVACIYSYVRMGTLRLEIEHYKEEQRKHLDKSVRMFPALTISMLYTKPNWICLFLTRRSLVKNVKK